MVHTTPRQCKPGAKPDRLERVEQKSGQRKIGLDRAEGTRQGRAVTVKSGSPSTAVESNKEAMLDRKKEGRLAW